HHSTNATNIKNGSSFRMTMENYTGTIDKVIFRNDDFLIAKFVGEDIDTTIKGSILGVNKGEEIRIYGNWEYHPKYGKQFSVARWERPMPETEEQAIAFLASSLVKGCGKKQAERIVDHLGANALERISNEGEECLLDIKGIGKKRAEKIVDSVISTFEIQWIIADLLQYGITANMAMKLYKAYGSEAGKIVKENPYKLTELNLIGFHKADEIAKRIGIPPLSGHRIEACLQFVLNQKCYRSGDCYLLENELVEDVVRYLNHNTEEKVS